MLLNPTSKLGYLSFNLKQQSIHMKHGGHTLLCHFLLQELFSMNKVCEQIWKNEENPTISKFLKSFPLQKYIYSSSQLMFVFMSQSNLIMYFI